MLDYVGRGARLIAGTPLDEFHKLRYKLYIEQEGWDVPHENGREYDEFDTPQAGYLLCRHEVTGRVLGGVRLLRSTQSYMIKDLWPDMLDNMAPPEADDVWEGSRLHADPSLAPEARRKVIQELGVGLYEFARRCEISKILFVMPPRLAEAWFQSGVPFEMLGGEKHFATGPAVAGWILCTKEALDIAASRFGRKAEIRGLEDLVVSAA